MWDIVGYRWRALYVMYDFVKENSAVQIYGNIYYNIHKNFYWRISTYLKYQNDLPFRRQDIKFCYDGARNTFYKD